MPRWGVQRIHWRDGRLRRTLVAVRDLVRPSPHNYPAYVLPELPHSSRRPLLELLSRIEATEDDIVFLPDAVVTVEVGRMLLKRLA